MEYFASIRVDALPKTENQIRGGSFWVLVAEKKRWAKLLGLAFLGQLPVRPLDKASVVLTRHSSKMSDLDNLIGSFKIVLDILKVPTKGQNSHRLSVILDDSPEKVFVEYRQAKAKPGDGHITIQITGEL